MRHLLALHRWCIIAIWVCVSAIGFAQAKPLNQTVHPYKSMLVISSGQAFVKKADKAYLLSINLNSVRQVILFSMRPYRMVSYLKKQGLQKIWYGKTIEKDFSQNAPNAVLSNQNARPVVVTLTHMYLHGNHVQFTFEPITPNMFKIPTGNLNEVALTIDAVAAADPDAVAPNLGKELDSFVSPYNPPSIIPGEAIKASGVVEKIKGKIRAAKQASKLEKWRKKRQQDNDDDNDNDGDSSTDEDEGIEMTEMKKLDDGLDLNDVDSGSEASADAADVETADTEALSSIGEGVGDGLSGTSAAAEVAADAAATAAADAEAADTALEIAGAFFAALGAD